MLLLLLFSLTLLARSVRATVLPSLTRFTNATKLSAPGSALTGCPYKCTPKYETALGHATWTQMSLTATHTLETHVLIINNRTNSTRTSTITNTDIDFAHISTPTNTNSAGTVTSVHKFRNGQTVTLTFPSTVVEDYQSTYAVYGTLPTVVNGASTCLTIPPEPTGSISASNGDPGIFSFPSHPPLPPLQHVSSSTIDLSQDPRGWTYYVNAEDICGASGLIEDLFPDLGVWGCPTKLTCAAPVMVLETALYLTATSISHEADPSTPSGPGPATPTPQPTGTPSPQSPPNANTQGPVLAPTGGSGNTNPPPEPVPVQTPAPNQQPFPTEQPPAPGQSSAREPVAVPTGGSENSNPAPEPVPIQKSAPSQQLSPEQPPAPGQSSAREPVLAPTSGSGNTNPAPEPVPVQNPAPGQQPSPTEQPPAPGQSSAREPVAAPTSGSGNTNPPAESAPVRNSAPGQNSLPTEQPQAPELSAVLNQSPAPAEQPSPNSPPFASIIPITTSFTNEQGSVVISTTHAVATPILQTLENSQGALIQSSAPAGQPTLKPQPSPPFASIIPITTSFTNEQGSLVTSTTHAVATPILQTLINSQGQTMISTEFSPIIPKPPITLMPQIVSSTNADKSVILATSNGAPVPVVMTSTNAQGQAVVVTSTTFSPVAANASPSPIAFIATTLTTTNAQGIPTVVTNTAAVIPIVSTSTNQEGQVIISTSILIAPATASTNFIITSTNAQGSIVSSTTQVPAVILTTTDVRGSSIVTTSPLLPAVVTAPPNLPNLTIGTQVITPNSQNAFIFGSQTLTSGGVVTVSGTRVSFKTDGTAAIVVGTSTEGLGNLITAGLGNGPAGAPANTTGTAFTGGAGALSSWFSPRWVEGLWLFWGLGLLIMGI